MKTQEERIQNKNSRRFIAAPIRQIEWYVLANNNDKIFMYTPYLKEIYLYFQHHSLHHPTPSQTDPCSCQTYWVGQKVHLRFSIRSY